MELFLFIVVFLCGCYLGWSRRSSREAEPVVLGINVIESIDLNPGDILVLKYHRELNSAAVQSIREQAQFVIPFGVRVIVIDEFTDIYAVLKDCSLDVTESNKHADDSNKDSPEPSPLSEVKLDDGASK